MSTYVRDDMDFPGGGVISLVLYIEYFRLPVQAPMFVLLHYRHSYIPACLCLVTLLYVILGLFIK